MRIAIGADHAGYGLKQRLAGWLERQGHEVLDLGTTDEQSVDYPDYAHAVSAALGAGRADRGLLVCGTGIGMSIAANRHPGIRAAKCNDPHEARMSRAHNDANVLCVGARILDASVAESILQEFLATAFEGGRHARRVEKLQGSDTPTTG
jgi:ribose 5-phosphate isomerase B